MRHCVNEAVVVFEVHSHTAAELFNQIAIGLSAQDNVGFVSVSTYVDEDGDLAATVYVH